MKYLKKDFIINKTINNYKLTPYLVINYFS